MRWSKAMKVYAGLLVLALAVPSGALAQEVSVEPAAVPWTVAQAAPVDEPRGYPYNTGVRDVTAVPLRDFLSARIDQLRTEILDKLDERQRLVTQRFDLTDKSVEAAFEAANNARDKAEEAQGLRNIVQNEFRGSLSDLGATMARRDWVEVQIAGLIDRIDRIQQTEADLENRIVEINSKGAGAILFWQVTAGIVVVVGIIMGIMFGLRRDRAAIT